MSLKEILGRIQDGLIKKADLRQEIQKAMRKATQLSKQAVFSLHKDKFGEAENTLRNAAEIFASLSNLAESCPDLLCMGSVESAYQEYAEARIFLELVKEGRFVESSEIGVPTVSYVLGLADVVGEFRRRALDFLRKDETGKAEECLELMETIYVELVNLDEIHLLVAGLRRKCDIARRVIESTRGDVTLGVRRSVLESSIRELREALESEKKG